MPLVAETRRWALVLRVALAACFAAGAVLVFTADDLDAYGWLVLGGLGPVLAGVMLGHRFGDRMVVEDNGLRLTWAPLGLGPLPLVRREALVPWRHVRALDRRKHFDLVPSQYVLGLDLGGRGLTWRLGRHTSNTRAVVAELVRRLPGDVVAEAVEADVQEWRRRGAV